MLLVLFHGYDRTAARGRIHDGGFVHRFDGVIVDDAALDAVAAEPVGRNQRVINENSAGHDRDVAAFAERLRLADFKRRLVGGDDRRFLAAEA